MLYIETRGVRLWFDGFAKPQFLPEALDSLELAAKRIIPRAWLGAFQRGGRKYYCVSLQVRRCRLVQGAENGRMRAMAYALATRLSAKQKVCSDSVWPDWAD